MRLPDMPPMPTRTPVVKLPSDQDSTGRQLGDEELLALARVIESGILTSTKGTWVSEFETVFARKLGIPHAVACCSGTAALHTAIAALDPEPGDEIITTPITDMGAITPILYQCAIPVFADVDPQTLNVTAESIARCLSPRTRAIMVTHLFGQPCDMSSIMALARQAGLKVIEDCSQAFLSRHQDRYVGTWGDMGCFSLQQGKHITTGEGGILVTRDPDLARRAFLFVNKGWGYGDAQPDHYFLALNYRMNELTGAVAKTQFEKLDHSVRTRIVRARQLTESLRGIPGLRLPLPPSDGVHSYWKYCLDVDPDRIPGGTDALGRKLRSYGIFSAPRYIQKPAFQCQVLRDQCTFGQSRYPFTLARPEALDYRPELFPGTFTGLARVLVLPWNERYTPAHVEFIARCIREAIRELRMGS